MKADPYWASKPVEFWHYIRVLSEALGYSRRGAVLRHSTDSIRKALARLSLSADAPRHMTRGALSIEEFEAYFAYRAGLIESVMVDYLQTADQAREMFERVSQAYTSGYESILKNGVENARIYNVVEGVPAHAPYNKQRGVMREVDFLTASSNILISHHLGGRGFDQDPRRLPVLTVDGVVAGSMSRRLDGAYPSCVNPIALWEYKCYYYTTTFGSKISDAVYIADLDGYERASVEDSTQRPLNLTLFIDSYPVWIEQGKSYLCRLIDLLQRGAIDNLVVGNEIEDAIGPLVWEWLSLEEALHQSPVPTQ